eukprot:TRINITY_DN5012_c0_g1_i15.p1 TRINITY_DN5012_c0_g1~~TRINITY_DN5012_c0_g1_i15.p1  ORF type:complete len:374 (+),score=44.11 TRINITY_DN5012_c0_g1_i15:571-1692(+)
MQIETYGLKYQFHTQSFGYFKNDTCEYLDENVGDIHHKIVDIEGAISQELTAQTISYAPFLLNISSLAAKLDCLLAFAKVAEEHHLARPQVTDENVLYITGGRHLIQEICVTNSFIPNDTSLAINREGSFKLITGPNYSGKSVYLKQVGLITFMAHLGSFVPAEIALIGKTDRIMTRIQSSESVSVDKSSFMIDCQQAASMTTLATSRSLLIIDEFGKGTNKNDGIAIAAALVHYFLGLGNDCPKILMSTHFHELLSYNLVPTRDPNLELQTMDITLCNSDSEVVFLYRLKSGFCTHSYGLYCAKIAGLPESLLKRAEEVGEVLLRGDPVEPIIVGRTEEQTERLVEEFTRFDPKNGDIEAFMAYIKEEKWRN